VDPDPELLRAQKGAVVENTVRSILLLACFSGAALVCGGLLWGRAGALISLGLGAMFVSGLWYFSARLILRRIGARLLGVHDDQTLNAALGQLSQRAGIPAPQLYLLPCPQPNAFSVGRSRRHASIVLTEGLVALLDPTDIRAVLAHELVHIRRLDILGSSITGAMTCGVSIAAEIATPPKKAANQEGRSDPRFVEALIQCVAGGLLRVAVSRGREGAADRSGSELIGDLEAMASALARIEKYTRVVPMEMTLARVSFWIVDPLGNRPDGSWISSTFPSVSDRIGGLRSSVSA
jgi:heat shock protein HtpX